MPPEPKNSHRVEYIDQFRAFAVICMTIALFAPGVFVRFPWLTTHQDEILFLSRFATMAFVVTFGVAAGYVYHSKFHSGSGSRTSKQILVRLRLLVPAAILINLPGYFEIWQTGNVTIATLVTKTFSVLNFYVLAVLSLPVWLKIAGTRHPISNSLVLGVAYWILAYVFLKAFPYNPINGIGYTANDGAMAYVGVNLIWGPYAYLQAGGTALIALAIGIALRASNANGSHRQFTLRLAFLSVLFAISGIILGIYVNELELHAIASASVKSPPRLWYWMLFSGLGVLVFCGLMIVNARRPKFSSFLYPLTLFGQGALPLFVCAALLANSHDFLESIGVRGDFAIELVAASYLVVFLMVMYYQHHRNLRRHSLSLGCSPNQRVAPAGQSDVGTQTR